MTLQELRQGNEEALARCVEVENPQRTRFVLGDRSCCRIYLDGEDVSAFCQAADEELGVAILFETNPDSVLGPWSRIADMERGELKRYARLGEVRIVDLVEKEGAENA